MRLALVLLVCAAGCSRGSAQVEGKPADPVEAFFANLRAGDCATAIEQTGGALRSRLDEAGCEAVMEEIGGLVLEEITRVTVDGRHPTARLVRVRLRGEETVSIIRVEPISGRWKIVQM